MGSRLAEEVSPGLPGWIGGQPPQGLGLLAPKDVSGGRQALTANARRNPDILRGGNQAGGYGRQVCRAVDIGNSLLANV